MRGDSRLGLLILAIGVAPAIIKKSKPLARYVGDHLVKFGEYFLHDSEDPCHIPAGETANAEAVTAPPVAEEVVEVIIIEEVVAEPTVEEIYETAPVAEEPPTPGPEPEAHIQEEQGHEGEPNPSSD